jgi:hypothetical protein
MPPRATARCFRPFAALLVLAGVASAVPAAAAGQRAVRQQVAGPAPSGESPGDEEVVFRLLRHQLTELLKRQDEVRTARGGYAMAFGPGEQALAFRPPPGVSLAFGYADSFGWSATASHVQLPGKTCVIWVGRIPPERRPTTRHDGNRGGDAEVVCDLVP